MLSQSTALGSAGVAVRVRAASARAMADSSTGVHSSGGHSCSMDCCYEQMHHDVAMHGRPAAGGSSSHVGRRRHHRQINGQRRPGESLPGQWQRRQWLDTWTPDQAANHPSPASSTAATHARLCAAWFLRRGGSGG